MQHVLFRFHRGYDICLQNLKQLRALNGDLAIHGLYGGQDKIGQLPRALKQHFETIEQPFDDPYYCWKNADLTVRKWYQQGGRDLKFRHLYLVEWDLLFFDSLQAVFGRLDAGTNYTTIHATYRQARRTHWSWIDDANQRHLGRLKAEIAKQARPVDSNVSFGLMPGTVFCRKFLDRYSAVYPSSVLNDEVRLSYWSQAFGIPLLDNGLRTNKRNIIDCEGEPLPFKAIEGAVLNGAQAIHSVRMRLPKALLAGLKP